MWMTALVGTKILQPVLESEQRGRLSPDDQLHDADTSALLQHDVPTDATVRKDPWLELKAMLAWSEPSLFSSLVHTDLDV